MSVKRQEARLQKAAMAFVENPRTGKASLLAASLDYAKSKFAAWNKRDKWKLKKRMGGL